VTAVHESEERYRRLVENLPFSIHEIDPNGRPIPMNPAGSSVVTFIENADRDALYYLAAATDRDRERLRSCLAGAHSGRTTYLDFETPDHQILQASFVPLMDDDGNVHRVMAVAHNITARKQTEQFLELENSLLADFTRGMPLEKALTRLVEFIELQAEDVIASVLLLDAAGTHVQHVAAANLPEEYTAAIDGAAIGESTGSCGTAAYRGEPVFVADIDTDPLWDAYRGLAQPHGLRACWSTPIKTTTGRVLGTIALYRREPGMPKAYHRKLITAATNLASMFLTQYDNEQHLRESERLFRTIFEQAAVGVAQLDTVSGEILHVNQRYCDILGSIPEKLIGETWMALTHPGDLDEDLANMERLRRGEIREFSIEKRLRRNDGEFVWIDLTVSATWQAGDEPSTHIAIVSDITERKRTEEQLQFTKFSVDSCSTAIFWIRPDATFLHVNDAALKQLGYSRDEMLSMAVSDIDPAYPAEVWPEYWARMRRERKLTFETSIKLKDGSSLPVEITTSLFERGGEEFVFAFVTDITERRRVERQLRQSRQQLRQVLDTNPATIFVKDRTSRILLANRAMADFYQLPVDEVEGKTHLELHAAYGGRQQEVERWLSDDRRVIENGEVLEIEETGIDRQGKLRHFQTIKCPLELENGERAVLIVSHDITNRKEAEEALRRSEEQLRELNASLDRRVAEQTAELRDSNAELSAFAHTVSHDLRAPLRAMEGFAAALSEDYGDKLDQDGHDFIQHIIDSANRMDTLVNDLLSYSRLGRAELRVGRVDLQAIVDEALHQLAADIKTCQADIEIIGKLPIVMGHKATLVQVAANLISNGIKFVPAGVPPQLRIWSEQRPDGMIRLWIEDHGIGIDDAYQTRVFQVFERLHGIESYPGTGIGLAIVARVCERLGGRCGVESKVGQGSRFWVEFPAGGGRP